MDDAELDRLLRDAEAGANADLEVLLPLVYDKLRRIAQQRMSNERTDHTLRSSSSSVPTV